MNLLDPLRQELTQEATTTRRLLERAPRDKWEWQPHPKSMTLGRLCHHVATIPANIATFLQEDVLDLTPMADMPAPDTNVNWAALLDESLAKANELLGDKDNAWALSMWSVVKDGKELMSQPRIATVRGFLLNHWIHHRGQLSLNLRLLDVPVPAIYGPSADENPFA